MSNNKHKFTTGDGCKLTDKLQYETALIELSTNGFENYVIGFDALVFGGLCQQITNEIPYNDIICLIKGELPNTWAVKCTTQTRMHPMWPKFLESIGGFVGDCIGEYYSPMLKTPTLQSGDTEILFTTWVAIYELNNQEQTFEEQVNECKDQTDDVAFIAIEDGRTLFKVDNEGFVSIGYTVVGHEPLLPKHFNGIQRSIDGLTDSDFNPNEPWEVSDDGIKFREYKELKLIEVTPRRSAILEEETGCIIAFRHIRNVKNPEFNASMLKVGEYMESVLGDDGKRNLVLKIRDNDWIDIRHCGGIFHSDIAEGVKGRKVNVDHNILPDENN